MYIFLQLKQYSKERCKLKLEVNSDGEN